MSITLEPTLLDSPYGDSEGILARQAGRLLAILSCLGEMHGNLLGSWYVEASLAEGVVDAGKIYPSLQAFEEHMESQLALIASGKSGTVDDA